MQLLISTTHQPATDLGYLLSKNPDRHQEFPLAFGTAHVFYPEATVERCAVALVVDVDPVGLVRGRGDADGPLTQYVNDRPYAASSFLAVAIAQVFSSAMAGTSKARADLAASAIALEAEIPVLRCRAGADKVRACFGPLGYQVDVQPLPLDETFPDWGASRYFRLHLRGCLRLAELLQHLYLLLPALDGDKHYYVGSDEVQKLLDKGGDWLATHPERDWILSNYLKRQRSLVREALGKLLAEPEEEVGATDREKEAGEQQLERALSLNERRMAAVEEVLLRCGAGSVLDVGCGEGRLLGRLLEHKQFRTILGIDVSAVSLERAAERLKLDRMAPMKRARIDLQQGSLTYRDARMAGFDAACAIEVIEHIDATRLDAFERTLFEFAQPETVVITTPNVEYNARFANLAAGTMRHRDHRFEWTRAEFEAWAAGVCQRHGYSVEFLPIGDVDPELGPPTQMGVFSR
ncbi:MAG: 3' terminal RNA ribose 2'-O-methyltransferase Hen1 [Lysobacterales bacterium]|nr:3' terminal RNA ribose 2'-O-methyltransferase Hen1 [Xanthomonadales bacterium]MCB1611273.1 3' terminal RNA ribose 2'-O-methyltransferase Hen1 [Xanthomonadales bacterium]MCP5475235.1 3' terminal RNA ribose 2'-O-methyltransferase Hen1 [Rhodanobacteraceae bacterium]